MKKFKQLLIDGISDEFQGTLPERLKQVRKQFESEYIYHDRKPSAHLLTEWLMGLPSSIHIPFENYKILEWYEGHLNRKIEEGVPVKGKARYETLLESYWPKCGISLYDLLYMGKIK